MHKKPSGDSLSILRKLLQLPHNQAAIEDALAAGVAKADRILTEARIDPAILDLRIGPVTTP